MNVSDISDAKIVKIHSLIEMMPDGETRAMFLEKLRTRLRHLRPPRRVTPLRVFCHPFERLLCDEVPKLRPLGSVPRSVLAPLWERLREHLPGSPPIRELERLEFGATLLASNVAEIHHTYEQALAALKEEAAHDAEARARGHSARPDFWEIVDDVHAVYTMRASLAEARMHILATKALVGVGEHYARSVAEIALAATDGGRRRDLPLFVLCLMLDPETSPHVNEIVEALSQMAGPGAQDMVGDLYMSVATREGEQLERLLRAPVETPEELLDTAGGVQRTLNALRSLRDVPGRSGQRLAYRVGEARRMLRAFLDERFLNAVQGNVSAFSERTTGELPSLEDVEDLSKTVLALSKVRTAAREVRLDATYHAQVERLRAQVHHSVANAMAARRDTSDTVRRDALAIAAGVARSLEPVCPQDDLLTMLEECAGRIGVEASASREQFLMAFIHFINAEQGADACEEG